MKRSETGLRVVSLGTAALGKGTLCSIWALASRGADGHGLPQGTAKDSPVGGTICVGCEGPLAGGLGISTLHH